MTPLNEPSAGNLPLLATTRRHFLQGGSLGLGAAALAGMMGGVGRADSDAAQDASQRHPHFAPRAKSIIYLHIAGSPPQHDLFDYKPELVKRNGQDCPAEFTQGERFAFIKGTPKLLGTPHQFSQHGESGAWISDILP